MSSDDPLYSPPLIGKRAGLFAIKQNDYEFLYDLWTDPRHSFLWRFRGASPGPETFQQTLWSNVFTQFLVVQMRDGQPLERVGVISAYNADFRNGFAYLALALRSEYAGSLLAHDANLMFVNYLFTGWPFRKLYGETTERHMSHIFPGATDRYVRVEGSFRQHEYFNGRYWDWHTVALYREDWEPLIARRLSRILPGVTPASPYSRSRTRNEQMFDPQDIEGGPTE